MPLQLLIENDRGRVFAASAGQAIARVVEAVPAAESAGASRAGGAVATATIAAPPQLGANVRMASDGLTVVAAADGLVHLQGDKIWIAPAARVAGDVDPATGNVEHRSDLVVPGSIRDLFKVTSGGSLAVGGAIEAAEVVAAKDLLVAGGIVSKGKGRVTAGGSVVARFLDNAIVTARGDVTIDNEISSSRVVCGNNLVVRNGAILASHLTVIGRVECQTLGSPAELPILIELGIDEQLRQAVRDALPRIVAQLAKVRHVRTDIAPLMENPKLLNPEQREKATELLFHASELDIETQKMIVELQQLWQRACALSKHSRILVQQTLHAGVTVRMPDIEATITTTTEGPVLVRVIETNNEW